MIKTYKQLVKKLGVIGKESILKYKSGLGNTHADLELEATEPIIILREHWLTEMIIVTCHQTVYHCGLRSILAYIVYCVIYMLCYESRSLGFGEKS